ncbi:MAG: formylglycine-generating enzyme family protein [Verrucomicrobia bacterium]|nr:formylglycine-generating enzyme family protein [Verrucomicrobiota bacterium]
MRLTQGFWLGKYPVTIRQWRRFADATDYLTEAERGDGMFISTEVSRQRFKAEGSSWRNTFADNEQNPVVGVSYNDAMAFAQWLTEQEKRAGRLPEGYVYTLPSESQWEYSVRAGTTTRFYTGNTDQDLERAAWFSNNSGRSTQPVGLKTPNNWGLYDMHGNVTEWTRTAMTSRHPGGTVVDFHGRPSGWRMILRGGGWNSDARFCESGNRNSWGPDARSDTIGFRLALAPAP